MEMLDVLPMVIAVFVLGATIQGTLGFGLPLTTMSLLSMFLDVPTAAALNTLPMLAGFLFQATRGGLMVKIIRRFWPLLIALAAGSWLGALLMSVLDPRWLLGILGVIVLAFCAISFFHPALRLPHRMEMSAGAAVGFVSGITGGVSTVHGPPLIMYAVALRLERKEFVAALGTFFLLGSVFMAMAFMEQGILTRENAPWSLACVPPVLACMWVGQRLSRRVDRDRFRKIVIFALLALGLNLVRRAVW
jgi:uncharacterized membrane protein YfcA